MMKIGINGFGRIGRAIFRKVLESKDFEITAINDINPSNENIAYQLKYDSSYGNLAEGIKSDKKGIGINGKRVHVFHKEKIEDVYWWKYADVVIDSSGVHRNIQGARKLKGKIRHIIITNSPKENEVDETIIMGVNEKEMKKEFIISSSICDANAIAPIVKLLDEKYGIEHGFVTTLHPCLQYQNLLDGSIPSFAHPKSIYSDYGLGRASTLSLIPKPTTAIEATCKVLKELKGKIQAFSYRVPTLSVSSSDMSIKLDKKVTVNEIKKLFEENARQQENKIFYNNYEQLVSIDFKKMEYSVVIDQRWTRVNNGNYLKLVLWYDNEWGYACRVVDLIKRLEEK